jgi:hypothetical protein
MVWHSNFIEFDIFYWIWFEIQLDSDLVEEKWDANWYMRYWKYACQWREMRCKLMHEVLKICFVVLKKIASKNTDPKTHLSVLAGANTKPKSIFVLMEPKLVYSIQAPMLPSSLELRLTACLTSIMYM